MIRVDDVRQYLSNFEELKNEIQQLQQDIDTYKNMEIDIVMNSIISDMPKSNNISTITSRVEYIAIKRADYIQVLERQLHDKIRIVQAINSVLSTITKLDRYIIHRRYFDIKIGQRTPSMEKIAEEMQTTTKTIWTSENKVLVGIIKAYYGQKNKPC